MFFMYQCDGEIINGYTVYNNHSNLRVVNHSDVLFAYIILSFFINHELKIMQKKEVQLEIYRSNKAAIVL